MARQSIETRVDRVEQQVGELAALPARVSALESQIVQFRSEVRDEFSAVRSEMTGEFAAVRSQMASESEALRAEMRAGDEESRRYMRVLHEEVLGRLATIQEGLPKRQSRRPSNG